MVSLKTPAGFPLSTRKIASTTSHARVAYWHYRSQAFPFASSLKPPTSESNVFAVDQGIIETEIESISTQKSMREPSGTFDITLLPSRNWRQVLAPGDWLVIYLFNSVEEKFQFHNKNVVMFGNVDRVARVRQKDQQTDKTTVRYHISGRDFGKVFEDTDVFFNPYAGVFKNPALINTYLQQRGLPLAGTPAEFVSDLIDVFLSADGAQLHNPDLGPAATEPLNQWKIPTEVSQFFQGGGTSFHDVLAKAIDEDLPGYKSRSVLTPNSNGGLWGQLKKNANELVNHLYCDLVREDGGAVKPTITLRSIPTSPFFIDIPGQLEGTSASLQDLAEESFVEISPNEIMYENIGRDGNYRFNHVWVVPKLADKSAAVNQFANAMNLGGIGLPMQSTESMQRYGMKKYDGVLEFIYKQQNKDINLDILLYKSFLNLIYDLHAYHHCYETGSLETSGVLEAELGKVLRVASPNAQSVASGIAGVPGQLVGSPAKLYLIEGYQHEWKFPGQWVTTFQVTMGQWENRAAPFIDLPPEDFGQFDSDFDKTSLVKTVVRRPGNAPVTASLSEKLISDLKGLV